MKEKEELLFYRMMSEVMIVHWVAEFTEASTLTRSQSQSISLIFWDAVEWQIHIIDHWLQQLCDAVNMDQHLDLVESMPRKIKAVLKVKRGVQPNTNKV